MSPSLAQLLCIGFVVWLFLKDRAWRPGSSYALIIPFIWVLIHGSRPVGFWLGTGGSELGGSPADALTITILFLLSLAVLSKRQSRISGPLTANTAFLALMAYFLISTLWAPYTFVAFKRWFREFAHIFVILIIATDTNPLSSLRTVFVRASYILVPFSLLLIKYFPHLGRAYDMSGDPMVTGVTPQKNSLGQISCVLSLFLIWDILESLKERIKIRNIYPRLIVLGIAITLLLLSQSKTSFLAFIAASLILLSTQLPIISRVPVLFARSTLLFISLTLVISATYTVAVAPILEAMGRDPTFTHRTKIWQAVLDQPINPILGSGFFSFWLDHSDSVWAYFYNAQFRSAHSGYIETYLDGGLIACSLLFLMLLRTSLSLCSQFSKHAIYTRLSFAIIIICLIVNFSETNFFRLDLIWFLTVFISLTHSLQRNLAQQHFTDRTY